MFAPNPWGGRSKNSGSTAPRAFAAARSLSSINKQPTVDPPHTEDLYVGERYEVRGLLTSPERLQLLRTIDDGPVRAIFGSPLLQESGGNARWIEPGTGDRSLGTVRAHRVEQVVYEFGDNDSFRYRLAFADALGDRFSLSVTDLSFRTYLDHLRESHELWPKHVAERVFSQLSESDEVWLRIGLARPWPPLSPRCHLQITGVYTFPDYLDGRCFADFVAPRAPLVESFDDVPF